MYTTTACRVPLFHLMSLVGLTRHTTKLLHYLSALKSGLSVSFSPYVGFHIFFLVLFVGRCNLQVLYHKDSATTILTICGRWQGSRVQPALWDPLFLLVLYFFESGRLAYSYQVNYRLRSYEWLTTSKVFLPELLVRLGLFFLLNLLSGRKNKMLNGLLLWMKKKKQ